MARINLGKVVPEKGIDYFTDAEVEEIKNEIKQEIDAQGMARDIELLKTDSGHSVELTLDPQTYQIILVLKNAAGTALSTQTIDLPNENAVTNLAYNNGILTVTKQSGATSQINLTGLIEGLVTESDFNTFKEALQATLEAINEKDAEQDEAISENYKVINKLNEKLENQQKVIDQLPQVTGQGTEVTLENTIEAQFTKFDVKGNSTQDGTPSPDNEVPIYSAGDNENILPANNGSETIKGVDFTKNSDGTIIANGTAIEGINYYINGLDYENIPAGEYTLSDGVGTSGGESSNTFFTFLDGGPNSNSTISLPTFTLSQATNLRARIVIRSGVTLDNVVFKPKLEKGNKASGYSPYGMGSINQKIQTRNLFDKNSNFKTYNASITPIDTGIKVENNDGGTYRSVWCEIGKDELLGKTLAIQTSISTYNGAIPRIIVVFNNETAQYIEQIKTITTSTEGTLVNIPNLFPENADRVSLIFYCSFTSATPKGSYVEYKDLQLEQGTTATSYVPHEEQDYSIFVQQPMMDDDHFDRKNNKEVHTWIKYVLDGSDDENWSIRNNKFFINDNVNYNLWEKSISPNGKSNIGVISYSVLDNHTGYGLALAYGLRLNLENIDASNGGTIEQLRAYLAEHPITIYVKLKDSAYEKLPCTPEQIQQLENLPSTYKDFTIIQSEDETPAYLEVSGIYDLNKLITRTEVLESEV